MPLRSRVSNARQAGMVPHRAVFLMPRMGCFSRQCRTLTGPDISAKTASGPDESGPDDAQMLFSVRLADPSPNHDDFAHDGDGVLYTQASVGAAGCRTRHIGDGKRRRRARGAASASKNNFHV